MAINTARKTPINILCASNDVDIEWGVDSTGNIFVSSFLNNKMGTENIEDTNLVHVGDRLVGINDDYVPLSLSRTADVIRAASLPMTLQFKCVCSVPAHSSSCAESINTGMKSTYIETSTTTSTTTTTTTTVPTSLKSTRGVSSAGRKDYSLPMKLTLQEYSKEEICATLRALSSPLLTQLYFMKEEEVVEMIRGFMKLLEVEQLSVSLESFISQCENIILRRQKRGKMEESNVDHFDRICVYMQSLTTHVNKERETSKAKWKDHTKKMNQRRMNALMEQKKILEKEVEKDSMKLRQGHLSTDDEDWSKHMQLLHSASYVKEKIEDSKRRLYLPETDGFQCTYGSDGVYVGFEEMWISSLSAGFSIQINPDGDNQHGENNAVQPHIVLTISEEENTRNLTTTDNGAYISFHATNVKISFENVFPSMLFQQLTVSSRFMLRLPLIWDNAQGWTVDMTSFKLDIMQFTYNTTVPNSAKKKENEWSLKFFLSKCLPTIVKNAAIHALSNEFGAYLRDGRMKMSLRGDFTVHSVYTITDIYDKNLMRDSSAPPPSPATLNHQEDCSGLTVLSQAEINVFLKLLRRFRNAPNMNGFSYYDIMQHISPFAKNDAYYYLFCALFQQAFNQLYTTPSCSTAETATTQPHRQVFTLFNHVLALQEFPVDCSFAIHSLDWNFDICEALARLNSTLNQMVTSYSEYEMPRLLSFLLKMAVDSQSQPGRTSTRRSFDTEKKHFLRLIDDLYEKSNVYLSKLTSFIDEMSVNIRGRLPNGVLSEDSSLEIEGKHLKVKGPMDFTCFSPFNISALNKPPVAQKLDSNTDTEGWSMENGVFKGVLHPPSTSINALQVEGNGGLDIAVSFGPLAVKQLIKIQNRQKLVTELMKHAPRDDWVDEKQDDNNNNNNDESNAFEDEEEDIDLSLVGSEIEMFSAQYSHNRRTKQLQIDSTYNYEISPFLHLFYQLNCQSFKMSGPVSAFLAHHLGNTSDVRSNGNSTTLVSIAEEKRMEMDKFLAICFQCNLSMKVSPTRINFSIHNPNSDDQPMVFYATHRLSLLPFFTSKPKHGLTHIRLKYPTIRSNSIDPCTDPLTPNSTSTLSCSAKNSKPKSSTSSFFGSLFSSKKLNSASSSRCSTPVHSPWSKTGSNSGSCSSTPASSKSQQQSVLPNNDTKVEPSQEPLYF